MLKRKHRPRSVSVVAFFLFAAAIIAFVVGTSLLFPGTRLDGLWKLNPPAHAAFEVLGKESGVLLCLLGAGTAATASGLLRGKRWAWWAALALFTVNIAGDLVSLFLTRDRMRSASGALIGGIFLVFLLHPKTAAFVRRPG